MPTQRIHRPSMRYRARVRRSEDRPLQSEEMELALVLEETRSPLGLLLSQSLRSVLTWAGTPPARKWELFADGAYERRTIDLLEAETPPAIAEACDSLSQLLARPSAARSDAVAGSCLTIASWARDSQKCSTRLAFLTAAASCCPHNAALALVVGREARDRGLYALSEEWLARAALVSRRAGEWDVYGRAHIAYGNVMIAKGTFPRARRHLLRAERSGRLHGPAEVRAMANHDLFVVAAECGDMASAHRSARAALRTYSPTDRRLVNLAFDLAFVWMREGYFEAALPVFRGLLPRVELRFLPHIHGALARAAGASHQPVEYAQAVHGLDALAVGSGSAEAWLDAASGAISLSRWDDAHSHAVRALAIAEARGERKIELLSETLLETVRQRSAFSAVRAVVASMDVEELAIDLATSLAGSAA